ncbi:MAG: 4Fe-4S binding protein [Spirochaetales bacterium]|nr:4Fe-4S binding protein [Spirochaetales bacterium]
MKRQIIKIDEEKCTGCGLCIPNCPEGALKIIDNKARLISDLFCDGLGACIGHCPEGAITIEERESGPYDERKVMENIIQQGPNVIKEHLLHLKNHGENEYLHIALTVLNEKNIQVPDLRSNQQEHHGCPGAQMKILNNETNQNEVVKGTRPSTLQQWPVQLHLLPVMAPQFNGKDLLVSADCAAYTAGDFHKDFLKGKVLAIACPKLDSGQEVYLEKLIGLIDHAKVNTITVIIMEVPCCRGLLVLVQKALSQAARKVPLKVIELSIKGEVLREEWV